MAELASSKWPSLLEGASEFRSSPQAAHSNIQNYELYPPNFTSDQNTSHHACSRWCSFSLHLEYAASISASPPPIPLTRGASGSAAAWGWHKRIPYPLVIKMTGPTRPVEPHLGEKIEIFWALDQAWYPGVAGEKGTKAGFNGRQMVKYEDGEVEYLDFSRETWRSAVPRVHTWQPGVQVASSRLMSSSGEAAVGGFLTAPTAGNTGALGASGVPIATPGALKRSPAPPERPPSIPRAEKAKSMASNGEGGARGEKTAASSSSSPAADIRARLSLAGRLAVITGGHRGLGASITIALASQGADVVVIDRSGPGSSEVPSAIAAMGRRIWSVTADVSSVESLAAAAAEAKRIAQQHARSISILVNNAGVALLGPAESLSTAVWDETQAVNVRAPMVLAQALLGELQASGCGSVVNISSAAGGGALGEHMAYCSSKAALNMMTKALALEWGRFNVRVNGVAPTVVMTDMGKKVWGEPEKGAPMKKRIPLNRFAEPHEVSDMVCFLASNASSMVTGQTISVDGGFNCA